MKANSEIKSISSFIDKLNKNKAVIENKTLLASSINKNIDDGIESIDDVEVKKPMPRPLFYTQASLPVDIVDDKTSKELEKFWRYDFSDFITGPSNQLAFAAAKTISEGSGGVQGLFLHSATGLGKTHLTHSVGKSLATVCNRRNMLLRYVSAESFASQFVFAMQHNSFESFKSKFYNLDVLLFEDVHFLQKKYKFQSALLSIVKDLHDRGGRVVFTSSFNLNELKDMDEQLVSRLSSGFLTGIERPDKNTRKLIFRHKAASHNLKLSEEVEDVLAEHISSDIRQIESCLQNLLLKTRLYNSDISLQMAWEAISAYSSQKVSCSLDDIVAQISRFFNVKKEQLMSQSRKKELVLARNAAFYLARKHTDFSLEAIGNFFNRRHSTVIQGITKLEAEMSRRSPSGEQLQNVISTIERSSLSI